VTGRPVLVDRLGFPTPDHPESVTDLPAAGERQLARLSLELWPEGEYVDLITEHGRRIGWQQ
jgi:hypothetical protein